MGGSLALTDMFLDTHRHLTGHLSASKHLIHAYGCGDVRFLFIKKGLERYTRVEQTIYFQDH
jgi:hypothetical protein